VLRRTVSIAVPAGGFFDGNDQASPEQRRAFLMDVLQSSAARQPADSAEEQALTNEQVVWRADAAAFRTSGMTPASKTMQHRPISSAIC